MEKEAKFKKGNNVLKVLLSILMLIIILLIIYEISIWNDGKLDKSNPMSREEVIMLLEKGKDYPNYYWWPETKGLFSDKNKTEYYIKDGIEVQYCNSKLGTWVNYNTRERMMFIDGNKAFLATNINVDCSNDVNQYGFDYSLIAKKEFNYEYKYLGEKEKDGRKIILVSVWNEDYKDQPVKFFIDRETGLIFERIDYYKLGFITIKSTCDRNVKLDIVTDEDIKRPDLSKYQILGK